MPGFKVICGKDKINPKRPMILITQRKRAESRGKRNMMNATDKCN